MSTPITDSNTGLPETRTTAPHYLDDALIAGIKITVAPRSPSVTGYGSKIPTQYMLKLDGRWHRVYVMVYSNSGTAYVIHRGRTSILESNTEYRLEAHREGVGAPTPQAAINTLSRGDRFRFHHDGVVSTLQSTDNSRYCWHDYQGEHSLWAGTYSGTGKTAWPYVYPTTDPETEVTLP